VRPSLDSVISLRNCAKKLCDRRARASVGRRKIEPAPPSRLRGCTRSQPRARVQSQGHSVSVAMAKRTARPPAALGSDERTRPAGQAHEELVSRCANKADELVPPTEGVPGRRGARPAECMKN